jgi:hypothetical protein
LEESGREDKESAGLNTEGKIQAMPSTPWYIDPEVWSAIGSVAAGTSAIAGLFVLILYTIYTKRMMQATEAILCYKRCARTGLQAFS